MTDEQRVLEQFGLSSNEAKVYLALLAEGQCKASDLAKKASLYRPYVYDTLEALKEMGLVSSVIKSGVKWFSSASPNKLLGIHDHRRRMLEDVIPQLEAKHNHHDQLEVKVYEGKEGLKSNYEELLDDYSKGRFRSFLHIGMKGVIFSTLKYYFPQLVKRTMALGMHKNTEIRYLADPIVRRTKPEKKFGALKGEMRFFPPRVSTPAGVIVVGDKVVMQSQKHGIWSVVIKNKDLAKTFRIIFNELWKNAER
ncbi:MAG: helix-turn-helix domain-containing protein [archaeon]